MNLISRIKKFFKREIPKNITFGSSSDNKLYRASSVLATDGPCILKTHPGYPEIIRLAERLGVKESTDASITISCGPNGTGPTFALDALIHATLDRLDAATE